MIENFKSSVLPLVLWTEIPPVHNITSILYLEKSKSFVTGSECGHIIIWSAKPSDNELLPCHYMISHNSKVVSLCLAGSRKHTDLDYFVSFSKDGELGLWEAISGRSIEFVSNVSFDVEYAFSYESENVKQRLILCCLKSPEIVVINSMSLSEICTLICTNSHNVFSAVTSFNLSNKDDVVLAITVSGVLSMWVLNFSEINKEPVFNPKFDADESVKCDMSDPIKIVHNPHHTSIVLIISACKLMIYNSKNWTILCYQNCRRGDYYIDGEFVSPNNFLIHCQSGKSFYYLLPPRSQFRNDLFGSPSIDLCDNIPKLVCKLDMSIEVEPSRHKVITKTSELGFVIWKGFIKGDIFKLDFKNNTLEVQTSIISLLNVWKKIKRKPIHLASAFENPEVCGPVTSLLHVSDLSLFVLGMQNGNIYITNFENCIGSAFNNTSKSEVQYIKLTGHYGAVTGLLHPCSAMKLPSRIISSTNPKVKPCIQLLKLTYHLWSAGEDFTVRIWDIKSQQCVSVFHNHSSPVIFLKLNHLPSNSTNISGFSQGLTTAMMNSINDDDPNSPEIRRMINTCMNTFIVAVSEDNGISIISMMKRKVVLHSMEHNAPIQRLGWALDNGYVLLETIASNVYVWDLTTRSLSRYETGKIAYALMENCVTKTKVRSKQSGKIISSTSIGRHSIDNLTSWNFLLTPGTSSKFLTFQLIKTGSTESYIPVAIIDLTLLLSALDMQTNTSAHFYSILSESSNPLLQGFRNSDTLSTFDTLMMDVTTVNRDMDLKVFLLKTILSRTHLHNSQLPLDSILYKLLDNTSDMMSCTFGDINSKTGCITFSIEDLFKEVKERTPTIGNMLLQLSISNKISGPSNRNHKVSTASTTSNDGVQGELLWPRLHSSSVSINNFSDYHTSTKLSKVLLAYKKTILDQHVPLLLRKPGKRNRFSDCPEYINFYSLERLFNSLVFGIMDVSDLISTSAYQILIKIIEDLSNQELQNYVLIMRMVLLPDLDHYTTEGSRNFSERIQSHLHKFSEQSFYASDWVWWYSSRDIKIEQDKRRLIKIQIKALVYLALIGTYMQADFNNGVQHEVKSFSSIFSLDNFFLARITCDFLMNLLSFDVAAVKKTKNRLVGLAMVCLSNGFVVWEPYLNPSTLICHFFKFTSDSYDEMEDSLVLSQVAKQSLRSLALHQPLMFVSVCHREMLRLHHTHVHQNSHMDSAALAHSSVPIQRMSSTPSLTTSYDAEKQCSSSILKKNILFPILDELCDQRSDVIKKMLPEVVELYIHYHLKFTDPELDVHHILFPVSKFMSVSVHPTNGHVSVGSSSGFLALFDFKIGKYFAHSVHESSINFTKFSDDAKHLATYSVEESVVKIWQISHTGLFHLGSNSYNVKMVSSQAVPNIDKMIQEVQNSAVFDSSDYSSNKKKRKIGLKKSSKKNGRHSYMVSNDPGLSLNWYTDNKTLSISFNGAVIRKLKI